MADEDGVVLGFNDRAEAMFGYSAEELVGLRLPVVLPDLDSLAGLVDAACDEAPCVRLEARRSNGVPFAAEVCVRRVGAEGAVRVVCTVREFARDALADEAQRYFDVAFDDGRSGWRCSTPTANTCGSTVRCAGSSVAARPI